MLVNNAVFGKTMENIRKHCNIKLVTQWEWSWDAEGLISKPKFKSSVILNENLVAFKLNKTSKFISMNPHISLLE